MTASPPLLEIRDLTRHLDGARALDGVNLRFARGEIVAVMGASGAGKSTLLHSLAGIAPGSAEPQLGAKSHRNTTTPEKPQDTQPVNGGHLLWHGRDITSATPRQLAALGIALVPQHPGLPDDFTVAGAVSLGHEPVRFGCLLDRAAMNERARDWLERLGMPLDPAARLGTLTVAQRQTVAIARALSMEPRLLLLDAPTAPLRPQDTDRLFEILGDLQASGTTVLYVSDRLGEIEALATRVVVLRDGRISGALARHEISLKALGALLVGNDLDLPLKELIEPGLERLRVDALRTARFPEQAVSFTVREGEIVGLAGLVGCGRTEVVRAIFGLDRPRGGSVIMNDTAVSEADPRAAIAAGAMLVPSEATWSGTAPGPTLQDALTLPSLRRLAPAGVVNNSAAARLAWMMNEHLSITHGPLDQPISRLTHGQRRKASLARWLALKPSVVLLDEPTRGIDMAARAEVYETMERLAERGAAVLFASNDMDELLRVADRLLVLRDGALAGTLSRDDDFTERGIMRLAAGL